MRELSKSSNAVFSLFYHLIIVVKYRQNIFMSEDIITTLKDFCNKISPKYGVNIVEMECGTDHVHILFEAKPTTDLTKFINILKGHSSKEIREKHHDLIKNKLWGDHLWSPSYFISTSGNVSLDTLINYVQTQRTLDEER